MPPKPTETWPAPKSLPGTTEPTGSKPVAAGAKPVGAAPKLGFAPKPACVAPKPADVGEPNADPPNDCTGDEVLPNALLDPPVVGLDGGGLTGVGLVAACSAIF